MGSFSKTNNPSGKKDTHAASISANSTGLITVTCNGQSTTKQNTAAGSITGTLGVSGGFVKAGATAAGLKYDTGTSSVTGVNQTAGWTEGYNSGSLTIQVPKLYKGGTVTPGTSDISVCPAESMMYSELKVKGDANLLAKNIKSGVSIFGVTGEASDGFITTITGNGSELMCIPGLDHVPQMLCASCIAGRAQDGTLYALIYRAGDLGTEIIYWNSSTSRLASVICPTGTADTSAHSYSYASGNNFYIKIYTGIWKSGATYQVIAV